MGWEVTKRRKKSFRYEASELRPEVLAPTKRECYLNNLLLQQGLAVKMTE